MVLTSRHVGPCVADLADRVGARLIVVGAANHPPRRLRECSIDALARLANQPIWVSRPQPGRPPLRILCALELSKHADEALDWSRALGRALSGSVTVVHALANLEVNPLGMSHGELEAEEEAHRRQALFAVERLLERHSARDLRASVRWGPPADVLTAIAKDDDADVIVLGRGRKTNLRRLVLTDTRGRLAREAPCSVVLLGEGQLSRGLEYGGSLETTTSGSASAPPR